MQVNRFLFEIPCQSLLGENILWHVQEQCLYWTDIHGRKLHVWQSNPVNQQDQHQVYELPHKLGCFGFTSVEHVLIAGFDKGIAKYNYSSGKLDWVELVEDDNEHTRINDGRCDPNGRFWFGTMVEKGDFAKLPLEHKGALYCARFNNLDLKLQDKEHDIEQALSALHISNSLCFSADGTYLYHADSVTHKVYRYTLDEHGDIVEQSLFKKFEKHCFPDGACVDIKGNMWIALWGGACIACIDPQGKELFRYPLPITQGSCVCIGGPKMNWLFVTSAQDNLSDTQLTQQPRAGNVFVYELSEAVGRQEATVNVASF